MAQSRYPWSHWPLTAQERLFKYILRGLLYGTLALVVGLALFGGSVDKQIEEAKEQYARVTPIVEDVRSLRARQGDLSHLDAEKAAWALVDDLALEPNLLSMHATRTEDGLDGVQATFDRLSLVQLTEFLRGLRDRASLQTLTCVITRNKNDQRLADAHFVLVR